MKIAIITLNYNGKEDTLELLSSLSRLRIQNCELKTIVVDNASEDGSVSGIHKQFPKVDILQTGKNLGFGLGYNRGLEYAGLWGADYFLLINNDSKILDPDFLEKLIRVIKDKPKVGMVAPKILFEKGFEYHKNYSEKDLGKVIWYGGGFMDWDNIRSVHRGIDEVDSGQYDQTEEVSFISGACFLISRQALEKVGGFLGDYFLYFEDAQLCRDVLKAGFELYYCGSAKIYHKVSRSTGIGSPLTDYYHTRNRLIFGLKYAKPRTKFALFREAVRFLLFGRPAQRKGVLDFYLQVRGMGNLSSNFSSGNEDLEYPLKLSVGIVNYKTAILTKKLLESIFQKNSGFDKDQMEIIVLDNGSEDNCREVIKKYLDKIKYLENKENEGFSKGYNKTIKYSLGQYYLMLNSDIEVLENGLSEIVKAAQQFAGNAALSGKLFFPDGSIQDSVFHLPTISRAFGEYFLGKKGWYFMYLPKKDHPVKVEGAVMACFLIPKKVIQKVGLLDEGTFIYFEDIEYCRRLKKYGIPFYFIPSAKFIHHHGASSQKIGVDKSQQLLQKAARYYHGGFYYFLISWVLRIGQKFGKVKTPVPRWTGK